jgi:hypothetical protein
VTSSGRFSTRDTVIGDTPASFATSLSVTLPDERLDPWGASRRSGKGPPSAILRRDDADVERDTGEPALKGEPRFAIALTLPLTNRYANVQLFEVKKLLPIGAWYRYHPQ